MSTTTNPPNGRVTRKTLAEQIDRLDTILDGLADGLHQAVVASVREAVEVAVRAVLAEVLASPVVLERLRDQVSPPAPTSADVPAPTPVASEESQGAGLRGWVSAGVRSASQFTTAARDRVRGGVASVGTCIDALWPYRRPLLVAAGIGVLVAILAYFAGPWLAALASGVGAFAITLTVQAGRWLKRTLGTFPSVDT